MTGAMLSQLPFSTRITRPVAAARRGIARVSLRGRVLILLACSILPAIVAQLAFAYQEFRDDVQREEERMVLLASAAAGRLDQFLTGTEGLMALLATQAATLMADPAMCSARLMAIQTVFRARYATLTLLDRSGGAICSSRLDIVGQSFADWRQFRTAIVERRFTFGDIVLSGRVSNLPVLTLAYPVTAADGSATAVIIVSLRLEYLGTLTETGLHQANMVTALVDRQGTGWSSRRGSLAHLPPPAALTASLARATVNFSHRFEDGRSYSYFATPLVREAGLHLVLGAPSGTLHGHLLSKLGYEIVFMLIFCPLALGGMYVATKQFVLRPLGQLQAAIVSYRPGARVGYHAAAGAPPEFVRIGDAFSALADAVADLHEKQGALLAQRELMIREVHHRIKNNLQQVSSLLRLQARRTVDPTAKSHLIGAQTRIHVIGAVHGQLYAREPSALVEVGGLIASIATQVHNSSAPRDRVRLVCAVESLMLPSEYSVSLCLVVTECLTNSYKYAFPDNRRGTVTVRLAKAEEPGHMRLEVNDDGIGLPAVEVQNVEPGFGAMLVRALARQLDGKIEITTGHGAGLAVTFPIPAGAKT